MYSMRFSSTKNNVSPNNILYELMLYTEWNQEADVVRSLLKSNGNNVTVLQGVWQPWNLLKKRVSLLDEVLCLQNSLLGWQFAVGEIGTVLAVLQDSLLEIRTSRDDFSSVVGKATVAKDSRPQWRHLCWSPDCSMLVVAGSSGALYFYDLLGSTLFSVPSPSGDKDSKLSLPQHSLAGMFFIPSRAKNEKWPFELVAVDYSGQLISYCVSPTDGFMEYHRFSLNRSGVSHVCWDPVHNLIIVCSQPEYNFADLKGEHVGWGLSAWRLLNDHPYYRRAVPSPEEIAKIEARKGLASWISSYCTSPPLSVVFKAAVSPDSQHLACLHTCGSVSIWILPSLRLHGIWALKEQPNCDIQAEPGKKKKSNHLDEFFPVDVSWWAEQQVMLARRNGAVSVCELTELRNVLGESPERLHGQPRLCPASTNKGVLVLECDTVNNQQEGEASSEEDTFVNKSTALVQSTVYLLTDLERFQPPRKRAKIEWKVYRLLGLKSTTPEDLFSRKIDAGEFEEALHLAEVYKLDTDRVYQSQWRNSPVSEESISGYLSKISKTRWVFEECLERVPDSLAAAKQLIEFGLKITSLKALADLFTEGEFDINEDETDATKLTLDGKNLLSFPPEELADSQKCLIITRRTLLKFSDRLYTYETMINSSEDVYNGEIYDKFRRQPEVLSAIESARNSDHRAVSLLLTYQGRDTLPYWLTILANFPETTSPSTYQYLLPECSYEGIVFIWEQREIRNKDWCEHEHFNNIVPAEDLSEFVVPEADRPLCPESLAGWYLSRAYEMERRSHLVHHALELVQLARQRNIKGLDNLHNELVTLDVLTCDVELEQLALRELEVMNPLQKAQALMTNSNEKNFVENLRHRLMPYLQRCEQLQPKYKKTILTQYLADVSSKDLKCPLKLFEYCKADCANSVVSDASELVSLALECVYAHEGTEQLNITEAILKTLPSAIKEEDSSKVSAALDELRVAEILHRRGRSLSLRRLHELRGADDQDTAKALFAQLADSIAQRLPAAGEAEWNSLLQDFLQMRSLVFDCMSLEQCYEVHTAGVLASGQIAVLGTAARSLCRHSDEKSRKPITFQRSVALVLQAAVHYYDSAASVKDPNISLAKTCLNLITEDNPEIQEENDLIDALQLLNEFKVVLLPMQVRLCPDRLKLVESCLAARPTAYKHHHRLLSLAHKLRVCGNDSRLREVTVLMRVANIAFEAGDYEHCSETCWQLASRRHAAGWEPAARLAQCAGFKDLAAKRRLVAFALVHCPDDRLLELIETSCELEHQELQLFIHEQTTEETRSEDEEFEDAVTSPQIPYKEFLPQLSSTFQNTSKLLTQLTDSGFWKDKLLNKDTTKNESVRKGETAMSLQGFHAFYQSLHGRCHQSVLSGGNEADGRGEWKQYRLIQALLRASLLEQEKLPSHLVRGLDKVLVQYASLVMPEDSPLGLAALMALSEPEAGDQCFSNLPFTALTLQLAVYFSALVLAAQHNQDAFSWTPDQVLAWATTQGEGDEGKSCQLTKALAQLRHLGESEAVARLDSAVDVRRFAWDQQYKMDSILGLAMCEEWEKVDGALELGRAHGVPAWQIAVSHIRSLLLTNSPKSNERLTDPRLVALLSDQSEPVVDRLETSVLPVLSGVNHNQLVSYYSVLAAVSPESAVQGLLPRDHVKLIKKVKATSPAIDYKRLLEKPLEALLSALSKDSVAAFARLLKEIHKCLPHLQNAESFSHLYREWAIMLFKTQCLKDGCRDPLEEFGALTTAFQKMSESDLLTFVRQTVFSQQAIVKLDSEMREAMVDAVLKQCHQRNDGSDDPNVVKIHRLKDYLQQVWNLLSDSHMSASVLGFCRRLDECCGEVVAVSAVIQEGLVDSSLPTGLLTQAAAILGGSGRTLPAHLTTLLRSPPKDSSSLVILLQRVDDCLTDGETGDNWSILLASITENTELPINCRKLAAQISQRLGSTGADELEALRLRTEAVLRRPVDARELGDANSRYLLFKRLISGEGQGGGEDPLRSAALLLTTWPHVENSWYLELIEAMAEVPNGKMFSTLKTIFRRAPFEEEEIEHLLSRIEDANELFKICVCLLTSFKNLHQRALEMLQQLSCDKALPEEVITRIVETGLITQLVECSFFPELLKSLQLYVDAELKEKAILQLKGAKLFTEAEQLKTST